MLAVNLHHSSHKGSKRKVTTAHKLGDNQWARELNLGEAIKVGCLKMIVGEWGKAEDKSKMRGKGIIYVPD